MRPGRVRRGVLYMPPSGFTGVRQLLAEERQPVGAAADRRSNFAIFFLAFWAEGEQNANLPWCLLAQSRSLTIERYFVTDCHAVGLARAKAGAVHYARVSGSGPAIGI